MLVGVGSVQVPLQLSIRQLIPGFVPTVQCGMLLHGIIGQVDLPLEVVHVELVGGRSDVPLGIPVAPHDPEHVGDQHIVPNIELPPVVQQRPVQIQLHNVSFGSAVSMLLLLTENFVELVYFIDYCDTVASVAQLARLNDPYITEGFSGFPLLYCFLLLLDMGSSLFVVVDEALVLGTLQAVSDVECQRQVVEHILLSQLVVLLEVVEHGFFVAQEKVILDVVVA